MEWDEYYDLGESIMKQSRIARGKPLKEDVTEKGEEILLESKKKGSVVDKSRRNIR